MNTDRHPTSTTFGTSSGGPARWEGACLYPAVGFAYLRTKGSHAVYRRPDGRVVVIPQHGTIKRGTLSSILRQADLTPAEYLKLLD